FLSFLCSNLLIGFICYLFRIRTLDRTASSIGILGTDVDPDGYAEAAGNLKAQGKT
ncbi:Os04g0197350, partial [Oryza sativa Japonica Group]